MTAKRFTLTYEKLGKYFNMGIVDHETKEPFDEAIYEFHPSSFKDSKDEMEDLCLLLNGLHEENEDRFNEQMYLQKQLHNTQKELEPIKKICKKYRIPIKDLPEILEEYIAYDNDDEW